MVLNLLLRLPVMPPYGPKCRWGWFFKTIEPKPLCPVQKIYGETRGENGTGRREGKTVRGDERGKRYGETKSEAMREDERSVPLILLLRLPVMPPYGPKRRWF